MLHYYRVRNGCKKNQQKMRLLFPVLLLVVYLLPIILITVFITIINTNVITIILSLTLLTLILLLLINIPLPKLLLLLLIMLLCVMILLFIYIPSVPYLLLLALLPPQDQYSRSYCNYCNTIIDCCCSLCHWNPCYAFYLIFKKKKCSCNFKFLNNLYLSGFFFFAKDIH